MAMATTATPASTPVVPASGLRPIGTAERIETIDVLRGFALFGILLVNFGMFSTARFALTPDTDTAAGTAAGMLIAFFASGKFYPLFSFLFGLGFAVQLTRAEARGGPFKWTYTKRLLVLLVIGILHGTLVWSGDVLTAYAVCGFVLLLLFMLKRAVEWPFRRADGARRKLPIWVALVLGAVIQVPLTIVSLQYGANEEEVTALQAAGAELSPEQQAFAERLVEIRAVREAEAFAAGEGRAPAVAVYRDGSWLEVTRQRVADFSSVLTAMLTMGPLILTMFLIGAVFGRLNLIGRAAEKRRLLGGLLVVGLVIGVPLSWSYMQLFFRDGLNSVGFVTNVWAGISMTLAYASGFALLMLTAARKVLGVLAPVGRMALTNYLLQSLVSTFIFYGYGLGMLGRVDKVGGLIYCVTFWLLQLALSHWWMSRFAFGPVEWLWRTLTYGKRQPMRLERASPRAAAA
jgi:uncharacterized protein